MNKSMKLSEHFTLGEMCKTRHQTADGNIPSRVVIENLIRYASILLDIADGTKQEFDELLLEQHGSVCWLHFAVRPKDNRRRIAFLKA